jgi:hypothetical protein
MDDLPSDVSDGEISDSLVRDIRRAPVRRRKAVITKPWDKILSVSGARRLVKAAKGRRYARDLNDSMAGPQPVGDKYGIVHKLFRNAINNIASKSRAIMIGQKLKTLLPRHVEWAILGELDDMDALLKLQLAPIIRRFKRKMPDTRLNKAAVAKIVYGATSRTIIQLRAGVGLADHENDRQVVRQRDITNAQSICQGYPQSKFNFTNIKCCIIV